MKLLLTEQNRRYESRQGKECLRANADSEGPDQKCCNGWKYDLLWLVYMYKRKKSLSLWSNPRPSTYKAEVLHPTITLYSTRVRKHNIWDLINLSRNSPKSTSKHIPPVLSHISQHFLKVLSGSRLVVTVMHGLHKRSIDADQTVQTSRLTWFYASSIRYTAEPQWLEHLWDHGN